MGWLVASFCTAWREHEPEGLAQFAFPPGDVPRPDGYSCVLCFLFKLFVILTASALEGNDFPFNAKSPKPNN